MGCQASKEGNNDEEVRRGSKRSRSNLKSSIADGEFMYSQQTVDIPSGEKIAYRHVGSSSKRTIVLIHGYLLSSAAFEAVATMLGKHFEIYAPDLRGFGHSSFNGSFTDVDTLVQDLKEFFDAVKLEKFYLLGWSAGGAISMRFASKYPHMVKKLALAHSTGPKGFPIYRLDDEGAATRERCQSVEEIKNHPHIVYRLNLIEKNDRQGIINFWRKSVMTGRNMPDDARLDSLYEQVVQHRSQIDAAMALNRFNISAVNNGVTNGNGAIMDIKCPVLIVAGDKDIVCPVSESEAIKAALGDNAELKVYGDCGHSCFDDYPEESAELFHQFFGNKKQLETKA